MGHPHPLLRTTADRAQSTGQSKPRVERTVPFVRNSFFAGECFIDLADAQRRAVEWCLGRAGRRIHGTHACRPVELFDLEEKPRLLPAPAGRYDLPVYATAKVHRDHHIEIARALYSIPGNLIGARVEVRADRQLVRVYHRGQLIKIHPRQPPGGRSTDPDDLPGAQDRLRHARPRPSPPSGRRGGTGHRRLRRCRCWTRRCRGPRCARSMPCSAW